MSTLETKKVPRRQPRKSNVFNHVQRWIEMHPDASTALDAARYLYQRMYVLQDMVCIQDKRRLAQLSQCLYEFRTKQTKPCVELKRLINSYKAKTMEHELYYNVSAAQLAAMKQAAAAAPKPPPGRRVVVIAPRPSAPMIPVVYAPRCDSQSPVRQLYHPPSRSS